MRITIAAVGRLRAGPERDLFRHYENRIGWPIEIHEVASRRPLPPAALKLRESELLRAAVPSGAVVVALDERGKQLTSATFARRIGAWRDDGIGRIAFLIGGAEGLDETLARAADLVLSLGSMTWPHLLCRALLAEQLYRAQQILAGHPYHRE